MVSLFYLCVCVHMGFFKLAKVFPHLSIMASQGFFWLFWFGFCLKSKACQSRRLLLSPEKRGDGLLEADGSMKRFQ